MARASAACFNGSGLPAASGGQTTPAIASPAASRRCRTSAANAAWPTRRMRTAPSALQVGREKSLQPLPGVARGLGPVGVALVAEEAMRGLRVDDHLGLLAVARELGLQLLDRVERDERVVLAEEGEQWRLQLRGLLDRDASPVERRRSLDLVGQLACDEKAHPPAHAEPGDADTVAAHEGLAFEVRDRAADVGHDLVVPEALHQGDGLG